MPRTLIRFREGPDAPARWGVLFGDRLAPLPADGASTGELLRQHWDAIHAVQAAQASLALRHVELLAPVTREQQFICQGINYGSHIRDMGLRVEDVAFNTLFTKSPACITAADADVVRPAHVVALDYEIELGLVLRRDLPAGIRVEADRLGDWLAGVTIVNDLSARDVQLPQVQFYKGKSYRGFGPVGPGLVLLSAEEWKRWPELHMRLSVNGQLRQQTYCSDMVYPPAATLTELAATHDVQAGDLIATGTPGGTAAKAGGKLTMFILKHFVSDAGKWRLFTKMAQKNPAYLKPGDRIQASIRTDDGAIDLGEQTTRISAP